MSPALLFSANAAGATPTIVPRALTRSARSAFLLTLLIAVIVLDRTAWAAVAGWREDQATHIWLGYTQSILDMPVGLISSLHIPNPNGLVLASVILSRLPNLLVIGAVLGVVQAALVAWVSWIGTRDPRLALLAGGPVIASISLRGGSVELWGAWMSVLVNLLFVAGLLLYIRTRSPWAIPLVGLAIIAGPSFYFTGLVNSIVFTLVGIVAVLRWRPLREVRAWIVPSLVTAGIMIVALCLVWLPYFREVNLESLAAAGGAWDRTPIEKISVAARSLLTFPLVFLHQFASAGSYTIGQVEPHLLSTAAWTGYRWLLRQTWLQGLVCYVSILASATTVVRRGIPIRQVVRARNRLPAIMVTLALSIVVASYMIAPLLGGPAWVEGQRLDQVVQFLPLLLMFWFITPAVLEHPRRLQTILRRFTCISAAVYICASMGLGGLIVQDNLRYRGPVLTDSDVPIYDKLRLVEFVAQDWSAISSSSEIPIDYDLGGGRWDWITDFGISYLEWYPAPYTIGRAFDYQLLKGYGLRNAQEGVQQRTFGTGRYLVNYSFSRAPVLPGETVREREFGRLRLIIRDQWAQP